MTRIHARQRLIGACALILIAGAAWGQPSDQGRVETLLRAVDANYVEPPDLRAMLRGGLAGLKDLRPERAMSIEDAHGGRLAVTYFGEDGTRVREELESPGKLPDLRDELAAAAIFARRFAPEVDHERALAAILAGAVQALDPYCAYLDREDFKDLQVGSAGAAGIGLELRMADGLLEVVSPIEGAPAFRAGVRAGDRIESIDDTPVKSLRLGDAVRRLRGKPGTAVALTLLRKGESEPSTLTVTRALVRLETVSAKMIGPGFAWLRVRAFQASTADSLARHLDALAKQGPLNALVLDLRNNPGGVLRGAVAVGAAFLPPKSLVLATDGRAAEAKRKFLATAGDYASGEDPFKSLPASAKTVPMVVLVNGRSASGSEIVAAALQDHKRATVLGTRTFGMGTIQTLVPLGDGTAVKLTTAHFLTPAGREIDKLGLTPDVVVDDAAAAEPGSAGDVQLARAIELLKATVMRDRAR